MPGSFIDTNVLVYLASDDPVKSDKAERVLDEVGGVISFQVLNEFVNVARRKMRLSWPEIRDTLKSLQGLLRVEPSPRESTTPASTPPNATASRPGTP